MNFSTDLLHLHSELHYSSYRVIDFFWGEIKTMFINVKMVFYLKTQSMNTRMIKCQLTRWGYVSSHFWQSSVTCFRSTFWIANNLHANDDDWWATKLLSMVSTHIDQWYSCANQVAVRNSSCVVSSPLEFLALWSVWFHRPLGLVSLRGMHASSQTWCLKNQKKQLRFYWYLAWNWQFNWNFNKLFINVSLPTAVMRWNGSTARFDESSLVKIA